MKNKLKQELIKLHNKAGIRPIVTANILLIVAIAIYGMLGIEAHFEEKYLNEEQNTFTRRSIEEKDEIVLHGKVADVEIRESQWGENVVLRLTEVRLDENVYSNRMTNIVKRIDENGQKLTRFNQSVQVWLKNDSDVYIGNYVTVKGRLDYNDRATNPGQFDAYKFYKNRGYLFALKGAIIVQKSDQYSYVGQGLRKLRNTLENVIDEIYSLEDAAIIKAMLLGKRTGLEQEVKDTFQKNGISHILAISGLHISFLCMGLYNLINRLGIRPIFCSLISGIILILYVVMVGMSASACRAGICFLVFLFAKPLKKSYDLLSALSLASILLLISNPGYLYDTAFQLSFLAVIAIVLYYKWFNSNILDIKERKHQFLVDNEGRLKHPLIILGKVGYRLAENLLVSGMVFMVTLPQILCCYYEVAWYSIILNLIIIPLMGVLLLSSISAIFLTVTVKLFSIFPLTISKIILWIFKITCVTMENCGWGRCNVGYPRWYNILIFYLLLTFLCNYTGNRRKTVFVTGVILAVAVLCLRINKGFNLYMVDVGQGDCIIAINDDGRAYIFDGGSSSVSDVGNRRIIPFLKYMGINEIEAIFLSHPDEDHTNGIIELLNMSKQECLRVNRVFVYKGFLENGYFTELFENVAENTQICEIDSGFFMKSGKFCVDCIYPDKEKKICDVNNSSAVFRIEYGGFSMLETGDIEQEAETELFNIEESRLKAQVLKVAHHGSKTSSSDDFLSRVNSKLALISVGANNRYGHPSETTLDVLERRGNIVKRTDRDGCIHLYTNGDYIEVDCWND